MDDTWGVATVTIVGALAGAQKVTLLLTVLLAGMLPVALEAFDRRVKRETAVLEGDRSSIVADRVSAWRCPRAG
jgi:hypothetical protein